MGRFPARSDDARESSEPRRESNDGLPRLRIESVRKETSGIATIAAGGSFFSFRPEEASALGLDAASLSIGSELDERAAALLALASEACEAERRGLALLARAENSAFMLRAKLELRGFSKKAVGMALARLAGEGLLDDERFARAYASARMRRRAEGPSSLKAALRERGVDADTADAAIAELLGAAAAPEERREALEKAAARILKRCGGDRDAARGKLRELGYGATEIRECLEGMDRG